LGSDFIGPPSLRKKNRFQLAEGERSLEASFNFVNAAAVAWADSVTPYPPVRLLIGGITGSVFLDFREDGSIAASRHGDPYPSTEVYQRRNGTVRTLFYSRERDPGAGVGTVPCLAPGVHRAC
jgi:hypothetical protein